MNLLASSFNMAKFNIAIFMVLLSYFVTVSVAQNEIETNAEIDSIYKFMYPGEKLELTCQVAAKYRKDASTLQWKKEKDGKNVTSSDNGRITVTQKADGLTSLVITKVEDSDLNNYTCFGTLGKTKPIQDTLILIVAPKVKVEKAFPGNKLELTCKFLSGFPTPAFSWDINGTSFAESTDRISLMDYEGYPNAVLSINNVQKTDAGEYVCHANNLANATTAEISVDFSDVPGGLSLVGIIGICVGLLVVIAVLLVLLYVRMKRNMGNL